jgi:hypothetical protein
MVLPFNLAAVAGIIIANHALWAPTLGTIVDRSFRYTVDKTTREILFMPLPLDVKLQAKPFVDVTVDRMAKGVGFVGLAAVLVVLTGALRVEGEGHATELAGAGAVIGMVETLAGIPPPVRADVIGAGQGLRLLRSDILDVIADDIGLLRGIFSGLMRLPADVADASHAAV